mmetsp:Transcript_47618/g.126198  ORF Transcript_47618/g.126198 Transcript_47618/m.126198 type:complete len:109 (+) Transcript_47618:635-961(+)
MHNCTQYYLYEADPGNWRWGTMVQIVRRTFLRNMIDQAELTGMGTLDVWWQMRLQGHEAFALLADVLRDQAYAEPNQVPSECHGVGRSMIANRLETHVAQPHFLHSAA